MIREWSFKIDIFYSITDTKVVLISSHKILVGVQFQAKVCSH